MRKLMQKWFKKGVQDSITYLPKDEQVTFILKVDNIDLGILSSNNGEWTFKYSEEFKIYKDEYNHIVGFPDLNKIYHSDHLWPFFQIRIPGLKQPAVQEIIKTENIDQGNEAALLKRFGRKTISNPYRLELA